MMPALGPDWMDPQWLLERFGAQFFWVSAAIVFVECGLLFPILPGDSLLFSVGLFIARGDLGINLVTACLILSAAAFLGNVVGYEIGRAIGAPLYERQGRFINKRNFDQTHAFFDKHGAKTIVLARFVPIVRTFAPIVAGVGQMKYRTFITYNLIGALIWSVGVTLLGHFLGNIGFVRDNIEFAIIGIVLLSLTPVFVELVKHRREAKAVLEGQV